MDAAQHNGKRKDRGDRGSASRKPKRAHLRALEPTTCPACGRCFNSGRGLANHLRAGCSVQVPDGAKSPDDALTYDATSDDEGDSGGTSSSTDDAGTVESTADDDDGPEAEVDLYLAGLALLDPAYLQRHSRLKGHLTKEEREIIRFLMVGIST